MAGDRSYDVRVAIEVEVADGRLGEMEGGGFEGGTSEIDCRDLRKEGEREREMKIKITNVVASIAYTGEVQLP